MAGTQVAMQVDKVESVILLFGNSAGLFLFWWSGVVVLAIYSLCNSCSGCRWSRCDLCLANIMWLDRIRLSYFVNATLVLPRICTYIFIYQVPLNMGKLIVKLNSLTPIFFYWVTIKRGRWNAGVALLCADHFNPDGKTTRWRCGNETTLQKACVIFRE